MIDEGDGFIGEGGRVQIFLSLAAYGDVNWIMVDAPQYCRCRCRMSDVHGGSSYLLQEGWTPVPANTSRCLVACEEPRYVHPVWQILEPIL